MPLAMSSPTSLPVATHRGCLGERLCKQWLLPLQAPSLPGQFGPTSWPWLWRPNPPAAPPARPVLQLYFLEEASLLRLLRHRSIVGFAGVCVADGNGIILSERAPKGIAVHALRPHMRRGGAAARPLPQIHALWHSACWHRACRMNAPGTHLGAPVHWDTPTHTHVLTLCALPFGPSNPHPPQPPPPPPTPHIHTPLQWS